MQTRACEQDGVVRVGIRQIGMCSQKGLERHGVKLGKLPFTISCTFLPLLLAAPWTSEARASSSVVAHVCAIDGLGTKGCELPHRHLAGHGLGRARRCRTRCPGGLRSAVAQCAAQPCGPGTHAVRCRRGTGDVATPARTSLAAPPLPAQAGSAGRHGQVVPAGICREMAEMSRMSTTPLWSTSAAGRKPACPLRLPMAAFAAARSGHMTAPLPSTSP
jgi:hypothetical protein